jgi:hypothetical protein
LKIQNMTIPLFMRDILPAITRRAALPQVPLAPNCAGIHIQPKG